MSKLVRRRNLFTTVKVCREQWSSGTNELRIVVCGRQLLDRSRPMRQNIDKRRKQLCTSLGTSGTL